MKKESKIQQHSPKQHVLHNITVDNMTMTFFRVDNAIFFINILIYVPLVDFRFIFYFYFIFTMKAANAYSLDPMHFTLKPFISIFERFNLYHI